MRAVRHAEDQLGLWTYSINIRITARKAVRITYDFAFGEFVLD